jgi:two-component system chemotaxis sensor kinase CheA
MDAMKAIYIEEANELLANLEISLLSLENNSNEKRFIEEIFRVMHTLKGNSSMFGLQHVAEFVHDLETIYDKVRNSEMELTKSLLDVTFLSLDHIKVIIHDSELQNTVNKENHSALLKSISGFIKDPAKVKTKELAKNVEKRTFYILFEPHGDIFKNGTNPMFLVSELTAMGRNIVVPHFNVTSNSDNALNECFTYWEIYLETEKSENDLRDVFMFVHDSANIAVRELRARGLLDNPDLVELISKDIYNNVKSDIDRLEQFINNNTGKMKELTKKNDTIIQEEEIVVQQPNANSDLDQKAGSLKKEKTVSSVRVASDKLDELMNLVSELVTTQAGLSLYADKVKNIELEPISENVEKLSRRLRDIAFGMTLIPINNMFSRFQRMVRDVSNSLGKEIEFLTDGGETELDKSMIETLTDPLMHILRNSLDHGIETGDVRVAKGKNRTGTVTLKAFYSGVYVYIQIVDDGKGIDPGLIRKKAIAKGLIKADDTLSESEIFDLIFYPGFSTAEQITEVSGRGVGMDVVKRNIAELKGIIKVDSRIDEGTTLTIKLPLTLSIIDGLLVSIDKVSYIIPLAVITKCYLVDNADMCSNFNELLLLDGEQTPFINTRAEFGSTVETKGQSQLIVVNNGERKVGLSVDYIIGEYQAVVKPLGKHYKNQDFISGASILGDGTIALVLDSNKIIELHTKKIKMEESLC